MLCAALYVSIVQYEKLCVKRDMTEDHIAMYDFFDLIPVMLDSAADPTQG